MNFKTLEKFKSFIYSRVIKTEKKLKLNINENSPLKFSQLFQNINTVCRLR